MANALRSRQATVDQVPLKAEPRDGSGSALDKLQIEKCAGTVLDRSEVRRYYFGTSTTRKGRLGRTQQTPSHR